MQICTTSKAQYSKKENRSIICDLQGHSIYLHNEAGFTSEPTWQLTPGFPDLYRFCQRLYILHFLKVKTPLWSLGECTNKVPGYNAA